MVEGICAYMAEEICAYMAVQERRLEREVDSLKRAFSAKLKSFYLSKQSYNFSIFCQCGEIC